jgi:hypothetical protein
MRNTTVALGAVAALVLAVPAFAAPAHITKLDVTKLDVVERAETDAVSVHGGTAADNVGDVLTFNNPIYDAANTRKIGSDQGYCVRLVAGKSMECHWTLLLAKGQIMVDGPVHDDGDTLLAVTGGTGAYRGAHGEMLIHARDAKATAYDFHYRLQ